MRATCLFALLLVLPARAAAQDRSSFDWKPYAVLAAGQSLDVVTTTRFLSNGSGCVESNARYGPRPSPARLWLGKAAVVGGLSAITALSSRSTSRPARVLGAVLSYVGGGVGAGAGLVNLQRCGWRSR